jgi:hypothetical protein
MSIVESEAVDSEGENTPDFDMQEQELIRFVEALKNDGYLHSKLFIGCLERFQKLR